MTEDAARQAAHEVAFCEQILAKTGDSVLSDMLRGVDQVVTWQHYPQGGVFDPQSGAQWYYHAHAKPGMEGEHGHFHCFLRPGGKDGPVHHLVAVGVDARGRLLRLFTVNQWVVDDVWLDAGETIALLSRFDVQLGRPSYLVNRWLSGVLRLYEREIGQLIRQRDETIAGFKPQEKPEVVRQDRTLEVTSELFVDFAATARSLGIGAA